MVTTVWRSWRLVATVEFEKRLHVAIVGGAEAGEVFRANRALATDVRGPFDDWAVVNPQPDIGEHSRPAAVAIAEGVNLDRPVVDDNCLFEDTRHEELSAANVATQLSQMLADVRRIAAQAQRPVANPACPRPDIAEHFTVQPQHPAKVEGGRSAGWNCDQIPNDGPPDVFGFSNGKLAAGSDVAFSQAVEISERRFSFVDHGSVGPEGLAAGRQQFAGGAVHHGLELMPRKTLRLEGRRRLHESRGPTGLRLGGAAQQRVDRDSGADRDLHSQGIGDGAYVPHRHGGLAPKDSGDRRGGNTASPSQLRDRHAQIPPTIIEGRGWSVVFGRHIGRQNGCIGMEKHLNHIVYDMPELQTIAFLCLGIEDEFSP
jgi:hypothetical protein